jgi:hypothetical protein
VGQSTRAGGPNRRTGELSSGGGDEEIPHAAASRIWGSEMSGSHRGRHSTALSGRPVALDGDMLEEQRREAMEGL